jgi:hypothetical protein
VIKVSVEVGSDGARFCVAVRAESIRQALAIAEDDYPAADIRLVHPIDPEAFFVEDLVTATGAIDYETPKISAGQAARDRSRCLQTQTHR